MTRTDTSAAAPDAALRETLDGILAGHAGLLVAQDLDGAMELYSEDPVVRPNHAEVLEGRSAVRSFIGGWFGSVAFSDLRYLTDEVMSFGDVAIQIGRVETTVRMPDGTAVDDRGSFVGVWVRDAGGAWRMHRNIFNSTLPLAAPGAAEA